MPVINEFVLDELSEDEDALQLLARVMRRPRQLRMRATQFSCWSEEEFFIRFRLSKICCEYILSRIDHCLPNRNDLRGDPVSKEGMLLTALSFYATGSFQSVCGDRHGLHKSTVCLIVHKVSRAIASLADDFITLPGNHEEIMDTRQKMFAVAGFPRCIGAIDCTHVRLQSPGGEESELFRNRKGFFSLNVQTVADADLRITDIVARWPGSTHDSIIFLNSNLRAKMEANIFENSVLLGDKGYALKRYLITPIHDPQTDVEKRFNEVQITSRNVVERSYGVWKRRFPVLANGLRVKLQNVQAIVVATAVLHNIAILFKESVPDVMDDTQQLIDHTLTADNAIVDLESVGGQARNSPEPFLAYFRDANIVH